jgi:hypothetical protein
VRLRADLRFVPELLRAAEVLRPALFRDALFREVVARFRDELFRAGAARLRDERFRDAAALRPALFRPRVLRPRRAPPVDLFFPPLEPPRDVFLAAMI